MKRYPKSDGFSAPVNLQSYSTDYEAQESFRQSLKNDVDI